MRIITQNGLSINFMDCEIWVQDDTICYRSPLSKGMIGMFESNEKAEEEFMEIHKAFEGFETVYEVSEKGL